MMQNVDEDTLMEADTQVEDGSQRSREEDEEWGDILTQQGRSGHYKTGGVGQQWRISLKL